MQKKKNQIVKKKDQDSKIKVGCKSPFLGRRVTMMKIITWIAVILICCFGVICYCCCVVSSKADKVTEEMEWDETV